MEGPALLSGLLEHKEIPLHFGIEQGDRHHRLKRNVQVVSEHLEVDLDIDVAVGLDRHRGLDPDRSVIRRSVQVHFHRVFAVIGLAVRVIHVEALRTGVLELLGHVEVGVPGETTGMLEALPSGDVLMLIGDEKGAHGGIVRLVRLEDGALEVGHHVDLGEAATRVPQHGCQFRPTPRREVGHDPDPDRRAARRRLSVIKRHRDVPDARGSDVAHDGLNGDGLLGNRAHRNEADVGRRDRQVRDRRRRGRTEELDHDARAHPFQRREGRCDPDLRVPVTAGNELQRELRAPHHPLLNEMLGHIHGEGRRVLEDVGADEISDRPVPELRRLAVGVVPGIVLDMPEFDHHAGFDTLNEEVQPGGNHIDGVGHLRDVELEQGVRVQT